MHKARILLGFGKNAAPPNEFSFHPEEHSFDVAMCVLLTYLFIKVRD